MIIPGMTSNTGSYMRDTTNSGTHDTCHLDKYTTRMSYHSLYRSYLFKYVYYLLAVFLVYVF